MAERLINQWGQITTVSIEQGFGDDKISTPDPSRYGQYLPVGTFKDIGTVRFEGQAPATPEIIQAIMKWARNGRGRIPDWKEEWMCLYCGTPQPLPNPKCEDCGAPRNWLIG